MHWMEMSIVGLFLILLLWGLVLTFKSPFDRPKHHDNRRGSYYYESNKRKKYHE